jgi:hypothetical protein
MCAKHPVFVNLREGRLVRYADSQQESQIERSETWLSQLLSPPFFMLEQMLGISDGLGWGLVIVVKCSMGCTVYRNRLCTCHMVRMCTSLLLLEHSYHYNLLSLESHRVVCILSRRTILRLISLRLVQIRRCDTLCNSQMVCVQRLCP